METITVTLPLEIAKYAWALILSMTWHVDPTTGIVDEGLQINYQNWVNVASELEMAVNKALSKEDSSGDQS